MGERCLRENKIKVKGDATQWHYLKRQSGAECLAVFLNFHQVKRTLYRNP